VFCVLGPILCINWRYARIRIRFVQAAQFIFQSGIWNIVSNGLCCLYCDMPVGSCLVAFDCDLSFRVSVKYFRNPVGPYLREDVPCMKGPSLNFFVRCLGHLTLE